jgi:hypothetical protein
LNYLGYSELTRSKVVDLVATLFLVFPESKVLLEKFNNALGVTEVILLELVNFVKCILESLVGKFASSLVVLHNFVVED